MTEEAGHEEEYPGVQGMGIRHVKQLPLEGLLELEIMTERKTVMTSRKHTLSDTGSLPRNQSSCSVKGIVVSLQTGYNF